jgi:acetyl-CoA synthetase
VTAAEELRDARDFLLNCREDYPRAVAEFSWPELGPTFCWAIDWFDTFARDNQRPGLIVVTDDESRAEAQTYSFDDLSRTSNQLARWFAERGVRRGDAVIVMLGNQVELWATMLAVMKLGAVIMPTTTAVGAAELADRIARGGARAVVCNPADAPKFDEVAGDYLLMTTDDILGSKAMSDGPVDHPGTAPDDTVLLYFTSGTTSRPKLVEHTQRSYPVGHLTTMYWIGLRPADIHLNVSSPGWAKHAWSSFFAPWLAEATVLVYNYTRFNPASLFEVLRGHEVTTLCAPPTVWRMLINADLSGGPGSLREVVAAGEPLNPEVIEQVRRAWGLTIRDGFGQTETTAQVGNTPGARLKPGSMGRPLPGVPVVLVDPLTGAPTSAEGEICLDLSGPDGQRPIPLMRGYRADEARNAEAMAGGFYHSGDVATIDSEGYITYVGRTDDVFKASDYKISPFELESVLIEHPAVAEAAVVPAPDPVRLAVPKAYIALAPGFEPSRQTAFEILRYAREHLAPYQRVRRLEFFDLPKTISGKIRRVELRARENEADCAATEYRDDQFPELKG